jgi:EAL domain-containing protein (putative c-di-GMP-specific phosphodiesterase class I)/GGDEF domain-containing protein
MLKKSKIARTLIIICVFALIISLAVLLVVEIWGKESAFGLLNTAQLCLFAAIYIFSLAGLIASLQRSYAQEKHQLAYDEVTGLRWRTQIPEEAPKNSAAYAYLTLKNHNQQLEQYGISTSNDLLKAATALVQKYIRGQDILYRFTDSELFLILHTPEKTALLKNITARLQHMVKKIEEETVALAIKEDETVEVHFTLAAGVVPVTHTTDSNILITYARFAAMEASKDSGPSVRVFDFKEYLKYRGIIERRVHLPELIKKSQLTTVFMPIVSCKTGKLYGYEALTRPANPAYKNISELLDDAEVLGLYVQLEFLMTLTSIQTYRELGGQSRLFINMAPETIKKRLYDDVIKQGVFDNIKFVIEIIERGEILAEVIKILNDSVSQLHAMIALDDFGTGYSNHLALLNSKPDIVKVSRELIEGIDKDADKQQIYENIVSFTRGLGTRVLAEGIETKEEFEYLLNLGMDFAQGYFIGGPSMYLDDIPEAVTSLIEKYKKYSDLLEEQQKPQGPN